MPGQLDFYLKIWFSWIKPEKTLNTGYKENLARLKGLLKARDFVCA